MKVVFISHTDNPEDWSRELRKRMPELEIVIGPGVEKTDDVDVAIAWWPPHGELARYPNLKAVLGLGAGVDQLLEDPDFPRHLPLTRLIDPKLTQSMTSYVLTAVLRHHRDFDAFERLQRRRRWSYRLPADPERRRVGVMGLGELGGAAVRALSILGLRMRGWSRTEKDIDGVETFHGMRQLSRFLAGTDILVVLLPLTRATRGLLDSRRLGQLPEGATVINSARGPILVEADLLAALDSGHIAGATLDVFHIEPLPRDHPFWRHPRILITPHVASYCDPHSSAGQMVENMRRLQNGRPLLNRVAITQGY